MRCRRWIRAASRVRLLNSSASFCSRRFLHPASRWIRSFNVFVDVCLVLFHLNCILLPDIVLSFLVFLDLVVDLGEMCYILLLYSQVMGETATKLFSWFFFFGICFVLSFGCHNPNSLFFRSKSWLFPYSVICEISLSLHDLWDLFIVCHTYPYDFFGSFILLLFVVWTLVLLCLSSIIFPYLSKRQVTLMEKKSIHGSVYSLLCSVSFLFLFVVLYVIRYSQLGSFFH